jgi:beta-glucosidase
MSGDNESIIVSATITNTGTKTGQEVVQCYVRDLSGDVSRPIRELKAFEKITLEPGESKSVRFSLNRSDLAFYNQQMKLETEPGEFHVWVAPNAEEGLKGEFKVR